MDAFLTLAMDDRRDACREAEARLRLRASSIEKDFWVCWTLRELFALPGIGEHLNFKGGTSLSKCWQLIERFSEDLDVTIHRTSLGFGGDQSPEAASSTNQRNRRLEALSDACCTYVTGTLAPAIAQRVSERVHGVSVIPDPDDPMSLLIEYPTSFSAGEYLRPFVKIELGARSDIDPSEMPEVRPYLAEALPDLLGHSTFNVRALAPTRTFWEKAMLLHEESYRTDGPQARLRAITMTFGVSSAPASANRRSPTLAFLTAWRLIARSSSAKVARRNRRYSVARYASCQTNLNCGNAITKRCVEHVLRRRAAIPGNPHAD